MFTHSSKDNLDRKVASDKLNTILDNCELNPTVRPTADLFFRRHLNRLLLDHLLPVIASLLIILFLIPLVFVPGFRYFESQIHPKPVSLVEHHLDGDSLVLKLSGDHILFDEAYLCKPDGTIIPVSSYDKKEQTLCFPFISDAETNIYIPVKGANTFQLLLTPDGLTNEKGAVNE